MAARIGAILKKTGGVISFGAEGKNHLVVTYDDGLTDEEAVVEALLAGGVAVAGRRPPAEHPIPAYR